MFHIQITISDYLCVPRSNVCSALKRLFQNNQITKMFTVLEIRSIQKLERKISITLANPDSVPSGQT